MEETVEEILIDETGSAPVEAEAEAKADADAETVEAKPDKEKNKSGKSRKAKKVYTAESNLRSLSLKFYAEQVEGYDPEEGLSDVDWLELVVKRLENTNLFPKDKFIAVGGIHDKDFVGDDFWKPSIEKPHAHIFIDIISKSPYKLRTLFNKLGINGSREEDKTFWTHHGAEPIGSSIEECSLYQTHETADAIRDGKTIYSLDDVHTNLTREELIELRDLAKDNKEGKERSTAIELEKINNESFERGYNLKDFDDWFFDLPFQINSNAKLEKTCRNSYARGIQKHSEENKQINRLSIFIQGYPGTGKTYATNEALKRMGKKVYIVDGGKNGKFDNLRASHNALVIDDYVSENLLKMSDNYMCQVYKRQSNNPFWCGDIFVAINNKNFGEWVQECNPSSYEGEHSDQFLAVKDRFYICSVQEINGINKLICHKPSKRGTAQEQRERLNLFAEFQDLFNSIIGEYKKTDEYVDYNQLNQGEGILPSEIEIFQLQQFSDSTFRYDCPCSSYIGNVYNTFSKNHDSSILNVDELIKHYYFNEKDLEKDIQFHEFWTIQKPSNDFMEVMLIRLYSIRNYISTQKLDKGTQNSA